MQVHDVCEQVLSPGLILLGSSGWSEYQTDENAPDSRLSAYSHPGYLTCGGKIVWYCMLSYVSNCVLGKAHVHPEHVPESHHVLLTGR